jgi:putative transposase
MSHQQEDNAFDKAMELLIENGFDGMADVMRILFNEAMICEREQALHAGAYQRTPERRGYANGFKPKTLDTRLGRMTVSVPKVRGDIDFYPSALDKGCRSERALKAAIAEMYVKGISTRRVTDVLEKMCGLEISSVQVSRATALLDEELDQWRERDLGCYQYLILDAHYEKVRKCGSVRSCAVFTAIGVGKDGKREILGVSVSLSEAEVHWRAFLASLLQRGLHGVEFITSDDHKGLRAAVDAIFTGVIWQRCQFHLQRNAQAHVAKKGMAAAVSADIRDIFNAPSGKMAQSRLDFYVGKYRDVDTDLADWMEVNIPEGLAVFQLPKKHRKRLRTTNPLERLHEEINRRTRVAGLFPNEASLLRLVSAIEMEISEDWLAGKRYLDMTVVFENDDETAMSDKNGIYRKDVA